MKLKELRKLIREEIEEEHNAIPEKVKNYIIDYLQSLPKYEPILRDSDMAGEWVEHEIDEHGNWIKAEDIESLITKIHWEM